jgi:Na+-translocating ferredoxin:NAD+ oxidoreductase RNF subunit RnfB
MSTGLILGAIAILGGLGIAFGILIALANSKLRVWEDPRVDGVVAMLPNNNCGACGFPGCRAFAEAAVAGKVKPAGCNVMDEDTRADVAAYLGVEAGQASRVVARLLCAGGSDVAARKADYYGVQSCFAAVAVSGGGKACAWGCVGYADCAVACNYDAITMSATGLPLVDIYKCIACGDCVDACPLNLFVLMPLDTHLIVQCRNLLEGEAATDVCSVACNTCGRCAADAPGLVRMEQGLAVVDYDHLELESRKAIERCPTGAIAWVEGAQFAGAPSGLALVGSGE